MINVFIIIRKNIIQKNYNKQKSKERDINNEKAKKAY